MNNVSFVKSVAKTKDLPKLKLPEIVLAGRSNVGKSSFINNLFNRTKLAKTSSSPGKTKTINYYIVDDKFYIVDMPGLGYAKVSKTERSRWLKLIEEYFNSDRNIAAVYHLIDARHRPTEIDILLNNFLYETGIPFTILLNKIDKLKQSEIAKRKIELKEIFPDVSVGDNLILYSALKGIGKKTIVTRLRKLFY